MSSLSKAPVDLPGPFADVRTPHVVLSVGPSVPWSREAWTKSGHGSYDPPRVRTADGQVVQYCR